MSNYKYVIFTDLDGTLLDKVTFQPGRALDTLDHCRELNIPVVFVSAKTRMEIESIRFELHNNSPFISENGGGLYVPVNLFEQPEGLTREGNYWVRKSKESITGLRKALKEIAAETGFDIRNFGDMAPAEVAFITGLDVIRAKLARQREFDEPFLIVDETPEKLKAVIEGIEKRGYRFTEGGILNHITGNFNKGESLSVLKNLYLSKDPNIEFIGLGDAYNDISMLKAVDHPFLVRKPDGSAEEVKDLEKLQITRGIGPDGFAESVEPLLKKIRN